jgi:hypothetical protein
MRRQTLAALRGRWFVPVLAIAGANLDTDLPGSTNPIGRAAKAPPQLGKAFCPEFVPDGCLPSWSMQVHYIERQKG